MKGRIALLVVVCWASHAAAQPAARPSPQRASGLAVTALRTEYQTAPLGIDARAPRFSWRLEAARRGVRQAAYQLQVALSPADLAAGRHLVWDSGRVTSDASHLVTYGGPALTSMQRYHWRVRSWDTSGVASAWSAPAWFEMGLLGPSDWKAEWIEPGLPDAPRGADPAPMLRRAFTLKKAVRQARAYVTSHGLYEVFLNGRRVGDALFTPGWTSYSHILQYQTYDVTSLLRRGDNAVGVTLGNGWYRGPLAWEGRRSLYGDRLALLLQIHVVYQDGSELVVGSDREWKASTGPILMSDIYDGEIYDARLEKRGWTEAGFDDSGWSPVVTAAHRRDHLVAPAGPPVRVIEELKPVGIIRTPGGDTVVDFGQNMVGWVRVRAEGTAGTTITLRHAEVLDRDGNFYTENLRRARATARYTLKGGGPEVFEPHFTFFGFRYVAVEGYPGALTTDSLTGVVVHSDMAVTGSFESSNPEINRLQRNILWGQKGNFLDVPTDCPQRDERLGWTGDAQVFARTAAFNMDVAGFFTKWLADLAADQSPDGAVPHVVPDILSRSPTNRQAGSAAWADAAVIIPWTMYLAYGDTRLLERQYPSMAKWVAFQRARAGEDFVWDGDPHFGDWLAFATTRSDYPGATTGKDLIATAFFARSTDLLARIAEVLGKPDDAVAYRAQLARIKDAFVREFVSPAGRVGENTQTAYVLALHFDLLPESLRPIAAARLARDVRERGHLTTGFVGTPYLCHVLTRFGYLDEAYRLLTRREYPSWLYPVTKGATTIWERWDGIKPDGTFQDKGMNSFNHYAYGAIGDWMYGVMAGLDLDEARPGYKHLRISPHPGGGFSRASAVHQTPYGQASSAWAIEGASFTLAVEVPPNATATIRLPGAVLSTVTEGRSPVASADGITAASQEGDAVVVEVGSGRYAFAYPWAAGRSAK